MSKDGEASCLVKSCFQDVKNATLYALDKPLDLPADVSRNQVIDAMKGHILAQGQLIGTYQR